MRILKDYKRYLRILLTPLDQENIHYFPATRSTWFQQVVCRPKPIYYASRPPKRYTK